ncbi:carbonic anhydrase [Stagonosporopsis vannaccii]|nr:carbonic anhydrase [Stagonosporopsis vannaccii]
MSNNGTDNLEQGNRAYVAEFTQGDLALPPSQKYAVLTCMDARIDPAAAFGIPLGAAHVIRNAGASARDAFRSLVISQQLLGTTEVLVVKHTGCGMLTFDNKTAKELVRKNKGEAAAKEVDDLDFLTFPDLEAKVKEDVEWLKNTAIEEGIRITGWVYENGPLAAYFQQLADLILRAPNLEHVCIVSVEHGDVSLWAHIFDDSSESPQQSFLKLKHLSVQIHGYCYSSVPGISQFERMLQHLRSLPMLSDLRISGATSSSDQMLASPLDEIPNLRRLDLTECNLEMVDVANLLLACKNLQNFTCVWQFIKDSQVGPSVLLPALLSCADTLETLALDWRVVRYSLMIESGTGMIGSLKPLKNLRSLEICELGFLSDDRSDLDLPAQDPDLAMSDLLPAGVEELKLLYEGEDLDYEGDVLEKASRLWQFIGDCDTSTPHLKTVCIKADRPMTLPKLAAAFGSAGIQMRTEVDLRK